MRIRRTLKAIILALTSLIGGSTAMGSFHIMQIEQVIGGVDGDSSAQAIQLRMRASFQNLVSEARLIVVDATGQNPILIKDMTSDVTNFSAGDRILIVSSNFVKYTSPAVSPDFFMTQTIPTNYLAAGRLLYEDDFGAIYWSLSWGGAGYTGSQTGSTINDSDGNFGPACFGPLPSSSRNALQFSGAATVASTSNQADYNSSANPATFVNNARQSFVVSGALAPMISVQPQNQTINLSSNATFCVTASGSSPLVYQWQFSGTNIVGETSNCYTRLNAQIVQVGDYTVVVTNAFGSVTSSVASLKVIDPNHAINWSTLNGGGGTSTGGVFAVRGTIGQLDAGRLTNGASTVNGGFWGVIGSPAFPLIATQPQSRTNVQGTTAIFAVTATGDSPLSYQWRRGPVDLTDSGGVSGASTSTLTLAAVQFADAGNYTVVVANHLGSVTSAVATLMVTAANLYVTSRPTPSGSGANSNGTYFEFITLGDSVAKSSVSDAPPRDGSRAYLSSTQLTNQIPLFAVQPALSVPGAIYQVDHAFSPVAGNINTNAILTINCAGGTFSVPSTDRFQSSFGGNVWSTLGYVTCGAGLTNPTITFSYESGFINANRRLNVDAFRFVFVGVPAVLSAPVMDAGGQFQFTVSGPPGAMFAIQRSTNLTTGDWVFVSTNAVPFTFTENGAINFPQRFYRAVHLP